MREQRRVTVLQVVSHAAGSAGQRSVGGPERRALAALSSWDPQRFNVVVAYSNEGRLRHAFEAAAARHQNVSLVTMAPPRRRDWQSLWPLVRIIRRHAVDVVHTQGAHGTDWWAATAARLAGAASVVTRPVALCDYGLPSAVFRRFRILDRLALSATSSMVFVSPDVLERSAACGEADPVRSRVIMNGVDLEHFRPLPRAPDAAPTFGMVGQLLPVKDWDTFLAMAGRVFDAVPESRALIVGDGPERQRLAGIIEERGWSGRVVMTGFREDVTQALAGMDVFVLTSRREGLPVSVIEAMAMAKPVVATDVGGMRQLVRPGVSGFLSRPGDAAGLAAPVIRLLQNPGLRASLGAAGRASAERRFSLRAMVRAYEALYLEAAGVHSGGESPESAVA